MKTKQLNFVENVETTLVAYTPIGVCKITKSKFSNKYIVRFNGELIFTDNGEIEFFSLEKAMKTAQDYFERRVNACFEE